GAARREWRQSGTALHPRRARLRYRDDGYGAAPDAAGPVCGGCPGAPARRRPGQCGAGRGAGMSAFANQIGRMTLLPPGAHDFLRRRLIEAGGCTLIALGVVYWAALMSFHPSDPSFNN